MDKKLKSENMQKREQSGQAVVENGAMLTTYLFRHILQNAPFCSQNFKFFSPQAARGH